MTRLLNLWDRYRTGFFFLPVLMTVGAIAIGFLMPEIDRWYGDQLVEFAPWLSTTPASAGRTLSAFGGAIATATGVVFSTVIVVLSLASGHFGSRLLRKFLSDTVTQFTLGLFVGNSLYCLLVMRVIREVEGNPVAPDLSVAFGTALSVFTFCQLIYFIHHIAVSIQAPTVIRAVADDLNDAIDRLFPEQVGRPSREARESVDADAFAAEEESSEKDHETDGVATPSSIADATVETLVGKNFPSEAPVSIPGNADGYLQAIDADRLMEIAVEHDLRIELTHRPGDFVSETDTLALARPGGQIDETLKADIQTVFLIGNRRTPRQDLECAIYELVEVALRALSPGINDPFTAMSCLDYLGACLVRLATREFPGKLRHDDQGKLRLITRPPTFDSAINAAFDQIRQEGRGHVDVTLRAMEALTRIAFAVESTQRAKVLRQQADMLLRGSQEFAEASDRAAVESRYSRLTKALDQLHKSPPPRSGVETSVFCNGVQ